MQSKSYERLIRYSFNLVSKKRYTEFEMRKKLTRYVERKENLEESDIDIVITRLIELKYLDDKQFVVDYANDRVKLRPRGISLIKLELRVKGINSELIDDGLNTVAIDETEIAIEILLKKMKRWNAYDYPKKKLKAYQFLYSKGFRRDAIYSAVESCYDNLESISGS